MKVKLLITAGLLASPAVISARAFAHDGEHGGYVLANIIHWLSSPAHSLPALLAGLVIAGFIITRARRAKAGE